MGSAGEKTSLALVPVPPPCRPLPEEVPFFPKATLTTLKTEFDHNDPKFWFANFERTIKHFGVKSQITKKEALINQLTKAAIDECKDLISQDEEEAGERPEAARWQPVGHGHGTQARHGRARHAGMRQAGIACNKRARAFFKYVFRIIL